MAINGTANADTLNGTDAADTISGLAGSDVLIGGAGNDSLLGGQGDDYIIGGAGNDLIDGGADADWASYEDATAAVKVDLALATAQITGGAGTDTLLNIENLYGSAFNDTLLGNAGVNFLSGGAGNDSLFGAAGDDHLEGGAGDDTLNGGEGRDVVSYADGNNAAVTVNLATGVATGHGADTLISIEDVWGGAGNDLITGSADANALFGNGGDDTLIGGKGADLLSGGAGNDLFKFASGDSGVFNSLGGIAADTTDTINDFTGGTRGTGTAAGTGDMLDFGLTAGSATNYVENTAASMTEAGTKALAAFVGNSALRYVATQVGADTLVFASDADGGSAHNMVTLTGVGTAAIGFNNIVGATTPTTPPTPPTPPTLGVAKDGTANTTVGDLLEGTAGDDTLQGLGGPDDTIMGGAGNDLIFARIDLNPRTSILEDTTQIAKRAAGDSSLIRGGEGNDQIWGGAGFDDINGNQGEDTIHGGLGNDWVVGGQGADLLFGDGGDDLVYGNLGNDTLSGGNGADTIRGGQGDDVIDGGAGDDLLFGDRGNDTMTGGAGADTFRFFDGAGNDRVTDFNRTDGDKIVIEGREPWHISQVGADTVITLDSGETLTLTGVASSSLTGDWIVSAL